MKKIILSSLIILSAGLLCFAEPVPQQDPAAADSPYYMDSNNILRQKTEVQPEEENQDSAQPDEEEQVQDGDEQTQDEDEPAAQEENTSETDNSEIDNTKDNNTDTDGLMNDKDNPINYDASQENMQDKNFKPAQRIEEPAPQEAKPAAKPAKQKKVKKNKKNKAEQQQEKSDAQTAPDDATKTEAENQDAAAKDAEAQAAAPKTYSQDDYEQMYRDMPVPTFTFVHGVDPDQYYDMKDTTWSPYPLLRLNAPLYFKTIVIPRGYYLLTPRQYKGDWYILFKEAGVVKYTIPVFAKNFAEEFYYRDNLKELDMTKSQRWQIKFLDAWGKYIRRSKRRPATKTNIELTDLDNNFLLIDLYYGAYKYSIIFRTERF